MYDIVNMVEFTDIVEVQTLELNKLQTESEDSRLCYWMEFIKAEGEIELEAVAVKDPLIKKAVARLMELSADEKTRLLYEAREKERMDSESREEEARDIGRSEERFTIARNALSMKMAIDDIIKLTGLTRTEVEALRDAK